MCLGTLQALLTVLVPIPDMRVWDQSASTSTCQVLDGTGPSGAQLWDSGRIVPPRPNGSNATFTLSQQSLSSKNFKNK